MAAQVYTLLCWSRRQLVQPAAMRRVPLNWAVMLWPAFAPWGAGQALQVAGQSMISSSQTQVPHES